MEKLLNCYSLAANSRHQINLVPLNESKNVKWLGGSILDADLKCLKVLHEAAKVFELRLTHR